MLVADQLGLNVRGQTLLTDVSFSLPSGQLTVLLGNNGAGKSTLLHLLAGVQVPTSGQALLAGRSLANIGVSERSQRMAVLLQEQWLDFPLRVSDVINMGSYPLPEGYQTDARAHACAQALDILHLWQRDYSRLSGGEKQRVHLARWLMQITEQTQCLLLDEPLKALDLQHQWQVMTLLKQQAHAGKAVLVVLHDLTLAARFADQVVLLDAGKLVGRGVPEEMMTPRRLTQLYQAPVERLITDAGESVFFLQAPASGG